MRIEFVKMHGLGNDFIVFDAPAELADAPIEPQRIRALADRHTGIGFDQALMLEAPRDARSRVFYRIFNADGGEVEQCGNGARCVAALLHARAPLRGGDIAMESKAGLVHARVGEQVSVDMGAPSFDPRAIPFDVPAEAPTYSLEAGGETVELGAVSMGNPHAVLEVRDVRNAPVARLGPAIERHARFPRRANVGFMQILDRGHIALRVFERGAGETLACGTGACAAVAVGRRRGLLEADVRVDLPGGTARVSWAGPGEPVWLTGPAVTAFSGVVDF
ncbi:MAG TPA: diaminopimelate epimerase [Steroidobacteraceae bacterium]|nr:diaminopimelate epimerase [Steroidobacteraceae bacterium]